MPAGPAQAPSASRAHSLGQSVGARVPAPGEIGPHGTKNMTAAEPTVEATGVKPDDQTPTGAAPVGLPSLDEGVQKAPPLIRSVRVENGPSMLHRKRPDAYPARSVVLTKSLLGSVQRGLRSSAALKARSGQG